MKLSARLFLIAVGPLATGAACGPGADPLDVDPAPSFSSVSACRAVSGTLEATFLGADTPNDLFFFGGPISGDLVGTTLVALTASENPAGDPPGPINFGAGTMTFTVTGGDLAGAVLVFAVEAPSRQDPPLAHDYSRLTLTSGARRGYLHLRGAFDYGTVTLTAAYRGSICP